MITTLTTWLHSTGLGLSIVQQICTSLHGRVDIESQQGVGTKAVVTLKLPPAPADAVKTTEIDPLDAVAAAAEGMTMCILQLSDVRGDERSEEARRLSGNSMKKASEEWFGMNVVFAQASENVWANILVFMEPLHIATILEFLRSRKAKSPPTILICLNAFKAASLEKAVSDARIRGNTIQIISQPVGPRKIAAALFQCLQTDSIITDIQRSSTSHMESASVSALSEKAKSLHVGYSRHGISSTPNTHPIPQSLPTTEEASQTRDVPPTAPGESNARPSAGSKRSYDSSNAVNVISALLHRSSSSEISYKLRPRVLLVDDNWINLKLLKTFVEKQKLQHMSASNGLGSA